MRYVDFPRPRAEIIALIGEANQSCPVLILGDAKRGRVKGVKVETFGDRRFVAGAEEIGKCFHKSMVWGGRTEVESANRSASISPCKPPLR